MLLLFHLVVVSDIIFDVVALIVNVLFVFVCVAIIAFFVVYIVPVDFL